ncbi:hypothetical protein Q604_UNBC02089G0001, partial [human gut metagenome]
MRWGSWAGGTGLEELDGAGCG